MEKCLGLIASKNCTKLGLLDGIEKKKRDFVETAKYLIHNTLEYRSINVKKNFNNIRIGFEVVFEHFHI
jgi:hypothetical protein